MVVNVAWIGHNPYVAALADSLEIELEVNTGRFRSAGEGLVGVASGTYAVILVNDVIPTDDFALPRDVAPDDFSGVGANVIERVRELPPYKDVPILVTHQGVFPGKGRINALHEYFVAGATGDIDLGVVGLKGFVEAVREYVPKEAN